MRTTLVTLGLALALSAVTAGCGSQTTTTSCSPACPPGFHCDKTGCVSDAPLPDQGGPTVDLLSPDCSPACGGDTPYCGPHKTCVACTQDSHCPTGMVCVTAGQTSFCASGCHDDGRCGGGTTRCCGGECTDTATDARNCGACASPCAYANGTATCSASACASGTCNPGWADCNQLAGDGCEANLAADPANCGGCGTTCTLPNATTACATTCYIAACTFGWADCDDTAGNGCETPVLTDPKNCGSCGYSCPTVPHAQNTCVEANCALTACTVGFADCDGRPDNGCEVGIARDATNCGGCGITCTVDQVCVNGACTCKNCNYPNAKTRCINQQCSFDKCVAGFADCNGDIPKDGCEVDTTSDPSNCGACGTVCPPDMAACQGGVCVNAGKCSDVATAYCTGMGWQVSNWHSSFPNAPGGSIYCVVKGESAGADCDTCQQYNQLVWGNNAIDACGDMNPLVAGKAYGGHSPCMCGVNNLLDCGDWPMMGCIPD